MKKRLLRWGAAVLLILIWLALLPVGLDQAFMELTKIRFKPGIYISKQLESELKGDAVLVRPETELIDISIIPSQEGRQEVWVRRSLGGNKDKQGVGLLQSVLPIDAGGVKNFFSEIQVSNREIKEVVRDVAVVGVRAAPEWMETIEKRFQEVEDCLGVEAGDWKTIQFQVMPPVFRSYGFIRAIGGAAPPNRIRFGYDIITLKNKSSGETVYHDVVKHELIHIISWREQKGYPFFIWEIRQWMHLAEDGFGRCDNV